MLWGYSDGETRARKDEYEPNPKNSRFGLVSTFLSVIQHGADRRFQDTKLKH